MRLNDHYELKDKHSFLSPSNYHWLNYSEEKLVDSYIKHLAVKKGIELHRFADMAIRLGERLPRSNKTLNMYVNDCIKYGMSTEQPLCYSPNCFGTADAIGFDHKLLRVNDLKTGQTPARFEQLLIYAALFCLEYGVDPYSIDTELRIYQSNECRIDTPTATELQGVMNVIVNSDTLIEEIKRKNE